MGLEIFPSGVFVISDLNFSDIIFSLTQPKSPPCEAVSEILRFLATFSKPSISIFFFIT